MSKHRYDGVRVEFHAITTGVVFLTSYLFCLICLRNCLRGFCMA